MHLLHITCPHSRSTAIFTPLWRALKHAGHMQLNGWSSFLSNVLSAVNLTGKSLFMLFVIRSICEKATMRKALNLIIYSLPASQESIILPYFMELFYGSAIHPDIGFLNAGRLNLWYNRRLHSFGGKQFKERV